MDENTTQPQDVVTPTPEVTPVVTGLSKKEKFVKEVKSLFAFKSLTFFSFSCFVLLSTVLSSNSLSAS